MFPITNIFMRTHLLIKCWAVVAAGVLLSFSAPTGAELQPEALIAEDALLVMTLRDISEIKGDIFKHSWLGVFQAPSMREFTGQFVKRWEEEKEGIVQRFRKEVGISPLKLLSLFDGQVTFAIYRKDRIGFNKPFDFDLVAIIDCGQNAELLTETLGDFRRHLSERGDNLQTETIRGKTFLRVPGEDFYFGQSDSLLIASTSTVRLEEVMAGAAGNTDRKLLSHFTFRRMYANRFKDSWAYLWVDFEPIYGYLLQAVKEWDRQSQDDPFSPKPLAILETLGLSGLQGVGINARMTPGGQLTELALAISEGQRRGVFEWFALEKKDSLPPRWVNQDVQEFTRTRLDLNKVWNRLEKAISEAIPPFGVMLNATISQAPGFREQFLNNLGDDTMTIGLAPRSTNVDDVLAPPYLILLKSRNPENLVNFVVGTISPIIAAGGLRLEKREFEGRMIYGVDIPGAGRFSWAADKEYVVFSSESQAMEEYLRGFSESKLSLRSKAGLSQSVKMLGSEPLTSFYYFNDAQIMRNLWEYVRTDSDWFREFAVQGGLPVEEIPIDSINEMVKGIVDFSLLPPFERVSQHFNYTVGGSSSDSRYINYRFYMPVSPQLR